VLASTAYLEQTLRNLIGNAEKYSPPDAPIEIEGHTDGDTVIVRVLDRGHGIDPEEAPSLFIPFYRSRATSMLAPGVGIGLAVCKRLIEAQDGRIWAACRLDAPGSEFAFSLPTLTEPD
jgi:K+-sensing histidine kinase KdpD